MIRKLTKIQCAICGTPFWACRSDARTCSPRCKKALQRAIKKTFGADTIKTARNVSSGELGLSDPASCRSKGDNLQESWPHGAAIHWRRFPWHSWKPGRVCWHCSFAAKARQLDQVPIDCGFFYDCFRPDQLQLSEAPGPTVNDT